MQILDGKLKSARRTLNEALETVKGRILINIEIKSEAVKHGVVPKVAALITQFEMLDRVVVSFSPEDVRMLGDNIVTMDKDMASAGGVAVRSRGTGGR